MSGLVQGGGAPGLIYDRIHECYPISSIIRDESLLGDPIVKTFAVADIHDLTARKAFEIVRNLEAAGKPTDAAAVIAAYEADFVAKNDHTTGSRHHPELDALIALAVDTPPLARIAVHRGIAIAQRCAADRRARQTAIDAAERAEQARAEAAMEEIAARPPQRPEPRDVPPPNDADAPPDRLHVELHAAGGGSLPAWQPDGRRRDTRPEIVLSPDQPAMTDAALAALAAMGGVYVRGRQLVHVVRDRGAGDWIKRPDGAPVIVPIERDHLLDLLGRAAAWIAIRPETKKRPAARDETSPPPWIAPRILTRGEWPMLPQLEGVSDAPVFRADGTIHARPGYDPRTRVIFEPSGVVFSPVPDAPTREDACRALAELVQPFDEFPFKDECDRSATAALILSMIGRAAIDGSVPMFGSQAPTPGSGKGLLASAATMIPTGRVAPLMSPTEVDEETRKRLLSIALAGDPVVIIDNVDGDLGSPPLAMAITAGVVKDRHLGGNRMVEASLRPVWVYTGNNVQLKGDMGRRVVPIDLDPQVENPEDRRFQRADLLGYVAANRPRLVVAALTVLRAFVVAGRPSHGKAPKGSFESWDALVRGAIIWAGGADPLGGVQRIRDRADDDLDRLRALLAAWVAAFEYTAVTIAGAILKAGDSGDLHDALAAFCSRTGGRLDARAIGIALRKVQGRPVDGRRFKNAGQSPTKVAMWAVERSGVAGVAGVSS